MRLFSLIIAMFVAFAVAEYRATWLDDQLATKGYLMASLVPEPGFICSAGDICLPRIDVIVELFDNHVRIRTGAPDSLVGVNPGMNRSTKRFDAQVNTAPFGLRIADRDTGAVVWNSVLFPDSEFVDGTPTGLPDQQRSSIATALPNNDWAVFAAGQPLAAGAPTASLRHENLALGERSDAQDRAVADAHGSSADFLAGAATLPAVLLVSTDRRPVFDGQRVSYSIVSLADRPLSVTRPATGGLFFEQAGGAIDIQITGGTDETGYNCVNSMIKTLAYDLASDATVEQRARRFRDLAGAETLMGVNLVVDDQLTLNHAVERFVKLAHPTEPTTAEATAVGYSTLVFASSAALAGSDDAGDAAGQTDALPQGTMLATAVSPALARPAAFNNAGSDSIDAQRWEMATNSDALLHALEPQGEQDPNGMAVFTVTPSAAAKADAIRAGIVNTATDVGHDIVRNNLVASYPAMDRPDVMFATGAALGVECTGTTCRGDQAKPAPHLNTVTTDATTEGVAHRSPAPAQATGTEATGHTYTAADHTILGSRDGTTSGFVKAVTAASKQVDAAGFALADTLSRATTAAGAISVMPVMLGAGFDEKPAAIAGVAELADRAARAGAGYTATLFDMATDTAVAPKSSYNDSLAITGAALHPAVMATSRVASVSRYARALANVNAIRNTYPWSLMASRGAPRATLLEHFAGDAMFSSLLQEGAASVAGLYTTRAADVASRGYGAESLLVAPIVDAKMNSGNSRPVYLPCSPAKAAWLDIATGAYLDCGGVYTAVAQREAGMYVPPMFVQLSAETGIQSLQFTPSGLGPLGDNSEVKFLARSHVPATKEELRDREVGVLMALSPKFVSEAIARANTAAVYGSDYTLSADVSITKDDKYVMRGELKYERSSHSAQITKFTARVPLPIREGRLLPTIAVTENGECAVVEGTGRNGIPAEIITTAPSTDAAVHCNFTIAWPAKPTPPTPPTPTPTPKPKSLSTLEIAGIAVGGAAVVVIAGCVVGCLIRRKGKREVTEYTPLADSENESSVDDQ